MGPSSGGALALLTCWLICLNCLQWRHWRCAVASNTRMCMPRHTQHVKFGTNDPNGWRGGDSMLPLPALTSHLQHLYSPPLYRCQVNKRPIALP